MPLVWAWSAVSPLGEQDPSGGHAQALKRSRGLACHLWPKVPAGNPVSVPSEKCLPKQWPHWAGPGVEVGGARASPQAQEGRREPPECPGRLGMRLPVALDLCPCHRPPRPPVLPALRRRRSSWQVRHGTGGPSAGIGGGKAGWKQETALWGPVEPSDLCSVSGAECSSPDLRKRETEAALWPCGLSGRRGGA